MSAEARTSVRVGARTLLLSNLDKTLWPRDGYTKGDLIAYYRSVAPHAIAHLKDRPLTRQRYPNGIDGAAFFEKQIPRGTPEWVERVTVPTPEGSRNHITFPLCNDEPSLVYFANLAAIVLHVWTSRVPALDEPELVLFDLDPGEKCSLKTLAIVALTIRDCLHEIGLKPLVKTTGGHGVHLVVPLASGYSYGTAKILTELVARRAATEAGELVTLARSIAKRAQAAVYIDYVQVGQGKTMVAPYSVRGRDRAPVSTPLHWEEVESFARRRTAVRPADEFANYSMLTVPRRLDREGDLWGPKSWKKQRLEGPSARAGRLWADRG